MNRAVELFALERGSSRSCFIEETWWTRSEPEESFVSVAVTHCQMVVTRQRGVAWLTVRGPETKATTVPIPCGRGVLRHRVQSRHLHADPAAGAAGRSGIDVAAGDEQVVLGWRVCMGASGAGQRRRLRRQARSRWFAGARPGRVGSLARRRRKAPVHALGGTARLSGDRADPRDDQADPTSREGGRAAVARGVRSSGTLARSQAT
jgi:hypothetical protein